MVKAYCQIYWQVFVIFNKTYVMYLSISAITHFNGVAIFTLKM